MSEKHKALIDRIKEQWAGLDPVDPLRRVLNDVVDALAAPQPDHFAGVGKLIVPEGWKLVPVEPTPEMLAATKCGPVNYPGFCWKAMLAAAPQPPAQPELVRIGGRCEQHLSVKPCQQCAGAQPKHDEAAIEAAIRAAVERFSPERFAKMLAQPEQDEPPMYYLQDTRGFVGNCPLWWGLNGSGYTTDLRKAQKYTLSEAMVQHRCRDSDLPWLCTEIDVIQRPTVDRQDMPRGHAAQREIVKAAHNIKEQS